jgi:hypothetical protein
MYISLNPFHICKTCGFNGGDYEEWRLLGCSAVWLALSSSERSVLTRATRRNIPEDTILFIFVYWARVEPKPLLLRPLIGLLYQP